MSGKRFSDRSLAGRAFAGALIAASLSLVVAAERDLQRRAPDELHGSKPLWRLLCLNALGATAYLLWGRREAQPAR